MHLFEVEFLKGLDNEQANFVLARENKNHKDACWIPHEECNCYVLKTCANKNKN